MSKKTFKRFALGALGGTAIFAAASYAVFDSVMNRNATLFRKVGDVVQKKHKEGVEPVETTVTPNIEWFNKQCYDVHEIESVRGFKLKGYLFKADEESKVFVFLSHGYRSAGLREYNDMAKFYHDFGYNVFIVDHQAHGDSEGKYIGFGYYEYQDGLLWLTHLVDTFGDDIQIILHGISMGSATVMMMTGAPSLPDNVKFTVADCGFTTAYDEFKFNLDTYKVPSHPILDGANFFNKRIAGFDFKDADALSAVKRAKIPMLFIHGDADWFVPTKMGEDLYLASSAPYKDLVLIKGAQHAESYEVDTETYENAVKGFAEKFITK